MFLEGGNEEHQSAMLREPSPRTPVMIRTVEREV